MAVKKESTVEYKPITLETHSHTDFTGLGVAIFIVGALLYAYFLTSMILSTTGWHDDAVIRQCVLAHLHNASMCLVKTYGHP